MGLRFVPHEAFLPPEHTLTICSCALGHLKLGSHYDLQLSTNLQYITMHHNLATLARFRLDAGSTKRLFRSLIHTNIYTIKAKFVILSQCLALYLDVIKVFNLKPRLFPSKIEKLPQLQYQENDLKRRCNTHGLGS